MDQYESLRSNARKIVLDPTTEERYLAIRRYKEAGDYRPWSILQGIEDDLRRKIFEEVSEKCHRSYPALFNSGSNETKWKKLTGGHHDYWMREEAKALCAKTLYSEDLTWEKKGVLVKDKIC